MRAHQPEKRSPAWFFQNNHQFLALLQVPSTLAMPASEVMDAVSRGDLEVVRINGRKAMALEAIYQYVDKREAKK